MKINFDIVTSQTHIRNCSIRLVIVWFFGHSSENYNIEVIMEPQQTVRFVVHESVACCVDSIENIWVDVKHVIDKV